MQRRKFMQIAFGAAAMAGLAACATPAAAPQTSVPAELPAKPEKTDKTEPTKNGIVPNAKTKPAAAATSAPVPTVVAPAPAVELPSGPIAPEIQSDTWLNTEKPVVWQDLRGKVVMVEFWTFG